MMKYLGALLAIVFLAASSGCVFRPYGPLHPRAHGYSSGERRSERGGDVHHHHHHEDRARDGRRF